MNQCLYDETKPQQKMGVLDRREFRLVTTGNLFLASQNKSINLKLSKNMDGTSQACAKQVCHGTNTWQDGQGGLSKSTPKWVILQPWKEERAKCSILQALRQSSWATKIECIKAAHLIVFSLGRFLLGMTSYEGTPHKSIKSINIKTTGTGKLRLIFIFAKVFQNRKEFKLKKKPKAL